MNSNREIEITLHACKRYVERFGANVNLSREDQYRAASRIIRDAFTSARYLSDNRDGVLFRADDFTMNIIVKDCQIRTVLPVKTEDIPDETSVGKSNKYHGPSNHSSRKEAVPCY